MPKAYFEPEYLNALVDVFHEAKRILERRGVTHPVALDAVARRILSLAQEGVPPWQILGEVLPPMTPEAAGLPEVPSANDIIVRGPGPHSES